VPALVVAGVAAWGLRSLPRRTGLALGGVLTALCLLDLRFRLVASGTYMDFKHLSFLGPLILVLGAAAVARAATCGRRRVVLMAALAALGWTLNAIVHDSEYGLSVPEQVPPAMFALRDWAARLPAGASVRVDIPAQGLGGYQLWAVYMLGDHPVDSPTPVLSTTYAHANYGVRARYSLSLRYVGNDPRRGPAPVPPFADPRPLFENSLLVLRRIDWPRRYRSIPDTASVRLVSS
jgi:hypothetical protein